MGRLDDAAKHKVVELRKAGLSFRKIKAVLELENIKVSAQAIYLYLRELQGGPPGRVRPAEAGSSATMQETWKNISLQNLLREGSRHIGFTASAAELAKQACLNPEAGSKPAGYGETSGSSGLEQQHKGDKKQNDIQIVSVTSLAQNSQHRGLQSSVSRAEPGTVTLTQTAAAASIRKRVTPSPATNAMLAARKRLLDKALSHKMKQSFHQVASLSRRDHASVQGSNMRSAVSQQPEMYDLTTDKTVADDQPGVGAAQKPGLSQRPGLSLRSPLPPPRVGIRLPQRPPAPVTSSATGGAIVRIRALAGQATARTEGNPSPHQAAQDLGGRGGLLQDQIQMLGSEVRTLAVAVKMLVEQQRRLEREQMQQTHVQKQILSTLQGLSFKLEHRSTVQKHHSKTPSPSALPSNSTLPAASTSTSFSQDNFSFGQGTYTQCGQAQPGYNSLEGLESMEAFKLPGLSPSGMNGYPPCSNAESLPLTHTPPLTQPFVAPYAEQSSQTLVPAYTQSYGQSHSHSFRMSEAKSAGFPTLQDCSMSTQPRMTLNPAGQEQQASIIKVEGP